MDPDNIAVLLGYEATEDEVQKRMQGLAGRPGFDGLAAVKAKRFFAIYHQFYNNPYHFVALQAFAKTKYADFLKQVNEKPELTKEVEAGYKKICEDFLATGAY